MTRRLAIPLAAAALFTVAADDPPRFVGAASCAAAGCHGGNTHLFGSEYSVWSSRDPHARAYAVLAGPRSHDMARRWRGRDADPAAEPTCLHCHAPLSAQAEFAAEGVSCESCHGAAEKWLDAHYTDAWRGLTPDEKRRQGFLPTGALDYRIGRCAECHVGGATAAVDHDLIAAGHPRLTFEYAAYHELLPRHWQETAYGKDFAARAWEIGQVVAARAAVGLLESRARSAASKTLLPEFAEEDCFACHHDLRWPSWRQQRGYGGRTPGLPPWGTWSPSTAAALARDGGLDPAVPASHDLFDGLQRIMLWPNPLAGPAASEAAAAAARLTAWAKALQDAADPAARGHKVLDKDRIRGVLLRIAGDDAGATWDGAAQTYLAVAALYQTLAELDPKDATARRRDAVAGLRATLRFPGDTADGPADFTPERFRDALKETREAFKN